MTYINPRSKLLWHVDRLAALRHYGTTAAPVNVEIDLSNRCSHGCEWCHFAHTHTRGPLYGAPKPSGMLDCGDLMDTGLLFDVLEQLARAGVRSITWSGGGEPTLHPSFNTIVEHAAKYLQQSIYTNGGHIDDYRAALLKRYMTFVYVSLDESTSATFLESKRVNRFGHVISGIKRLVAAPGPATVGVGFLLHSGNYRQIYHMVELGRELGVDYVQFRPTVNYDQASPGQRSEDAAWVSEAIPLLQQYVGDPFVQAEPERFAMYRDWQGHGYATCNWSAMQTVITPNGQVWRCANRRGHESALMGDLTKEDFASIWARAGGACAVEQDCRIMCRGHIANITLDAIMTEPIHANFI